ncbi:hypothetical protein ETC02_14825 [Geobacillus sp. DSP4a]|nr:hypothetical protein [Geobacillus sp. DSP4a]
MTMRMHLQKQGCSRPRGTKPPNECLIARGPSAAIGEQLVCSVVSIEMPDWRVTEQHRFQTHAWVWEAGGYSVFRHTLARRRQACGLPSAVGKIDDTLLGQRNVKSSS